MTTVAEIITTRIVEQLENGVIPWKCPYQTFSSKNLATGREYTGINRILLTEGLYATYKQIQSLGFSIKKGEENKSSIAVFYSTAYNRKNKKTNEQETVHHPPVMRYYHIWSLNQIEMPDGKRAEYVASMSPAQVQDIDQNVNNLVNLLESYADNEHIARISTIDTPCYFPVYDRIEMPSRESFDSDETYGSTYAHEATHSTGHKNRLNRDKKSYAYEELIAELGAAFLCGHFGVVTNLNNEQHAAYIQSWMRNLSDDPGLIISSASKAEKAYQYILTHH